MARLAKLPKGYFWRGPYIWCRTDPITKKAVSTECQDVASLKRWTKERERNSEDPRYAAAHKATLGDWVTKTMDVKRTDKSAATLRVYKQKLGHFVNAWGENMPLVEITPDLCDDYTAARRGHGAAEMTICKEFSALTQLLKLARRAGCYPHQIEALRPLNLAPHYVPRDRHLSLAEVTALRNACLPRLRAIVSVAVCTGARLSEALSFATSDLDQRSWVAHLRGTKTEGSDRLVPVLPPFRPWLLDVLEVTPVGSYRNNLRRDLLKACERAGIAPCTPNDLRRTHASLLVASGVDRDVVRRIMGHSTSRMVEMVYGRIDPAELAALADPHIQTLALPAHSEAQPAVKVSQKTGRSYFAKSNKKRNNQGDTDAVFEESNENTENSRANFEVRTRDLRFTKPLTRTLETAYSTENTGGLARVTSDEVASIPGASVTRGVTILDSLDARARSTVETLGTLRTVNLAELVAGADRSMIAPELPALAHCAISLGLHLDSRPDFAALERLGGA